MRERKEDEELVLLRKGPALVAWDLLERTLLSDEAMKEISAGHYELLVKLDEAERLALHHLVGAIQRVIPDAVYPVDSALIAEAKQALELRHKRS